jgi:hypothetical protein
MTFIQIYIILTGAIIQTRNIATVINISFTVHPSVAMLAFTTVVAYSINACSIMMAWKGRAFINVMLTMVSSVTTGAVTLKTIPHILT